MSNHNHRHSLFLFAVVIAGVGRSVAAPVHNTQVNAAAAPAIMPHNAYDYFMAASDAARETNGNAQAERASGQIPPDGKTHIYTLAEKEATLQANALPLSLARQGFPYPFTPPPSKDPYIVNFPVYAGFRNLGRLLRFEAQVRAERGDWAGAMDSDFDAIQLNKGTKVIVTLPPPIRPAWGFGSSYR